jgi:ubiquinone/menaquinone biosynthesis C-methylase UbiE
MISDMETNIDSRTVAGFGDEWSRFDQTALADTELNKLWDQYFSQFPWASLSATAVGMDVGCGSGRWAKIVAPRVGKLHLVDASPQALAVARSNLEAYKNCEFHIASVDQLPVPDQSLDFGYSLGVLHHVPDTLEGIRSCAAKLKKGAPFLLYLYYRFDNRPRWFSALWRVSDALRKFISRLPHPVRYQVCQAIAATVYFPLARTARTLERFGAKIESWPLAFYRDRSFYTMRTDALDRFGTRLEQRFTAHEIRLMMEEAGFEKITFNPSAPFWCAIGQKA